ncbi:MAG: hypothetical protein JXA43_03050 [Candidatus Diapherotrites archaeon]|nr:hypothetical protein [Candidatus Diapherotrites archaeon]
MAKKTVSKRTVSESSEKKQTKLLIKYLNFWGTEISYLALIFLALFSLLIIGAMGYQLDETSRYLIYTIIAMGFILVLTAQYKRKSLERELEKL